MTAAATTGGRPRGWDAPEPRSHVGHLLRRAWQAHGELWSKEGGTDLTPQQYAVLVAVAGNPGIDQRGAGAKASLDKSTAADVIRRLTERGLLTRSRATTDARRDALTLTSEGLRLAKRTTPAVERLNRTLLSPLSAAEQSRLLQLLERVAIRERTPAP